MSAVAGDVHSLESFELSSAAAIKSYRPALELGARLGGKAAAIHVRNADLIEVSDALAALAGEHGLGVNIEPLAMCQTATLAQARDLIHAARVDAGIVFDVYHLVRSGGGVRELRAIEPSLIRYIQINDGAASVALEAMTALRRLIDEIQAPS